MYGEPVLTVRTRRWWRSAWTLAGLLASAGAIHGASNSGADSREEAGYRAFRRGAFSEAVAEWDISELNLRRAGRTNRLIALKIDLAAAYQGLGHHRRAAGILSDAVALAERSGDRGQQILAKSKLGSAMAMMMESSRAEALLSESLEMARSDKKPELIAAVLNDLGNLLATQQRRDEALTLFDESSNLARQAGDATLAAQALVNAASTAAAAGMEERAETLNQSAIKAIEILEDSHQKAFLLLTAGLVDRQAKLATGDAAERRLLRSHRSLQLAAKTAEAINDRLMTSYALGYLGQLYESDRQVDHALALTQRAAFVAQQIRAPDALYRWEWQAGRLLNSQGKSQEAIGAYRRAVQTLQPIRHDIALGYGNAITRGTFRATLGPLFFDLADLLLQQTDKEPDPAKKQLLLVQARDTVEQLKMVELEDYFQDECVNVQRAKTKALETVDAHTAVIYLIPLATRTEVLVGLTGGIHRFTANVGVDALTEEVRSFRRKLETRTTHGYRKEAEAIYDWIVRPIHGLLTNHQIDTLVFVPDGALQTIPLASLHDGEKFLIEEFAVGVSPGLSLLEPQSIERDNVHLLLTGLSEAVQGFPALDFVPAELQNIKPVYRSETLLNNAFVMPTLTRKLTDEQYSIVHIASHGQFDRDAHKTFVLTYDGKLTLNDLEALIRPGQYRGKPVELLVLSACQTAAGDDRAALGLAGVAVKAGARSALASLWFVNDQSTSVLITDVYQNLQKSPAISKAKALQAAQIAMLGDRRYRHPCYWAPYLIIGNWL